MDFRALFEHSPVPLLVLAPELRIVAVTDTRRGVDPDSIKRLFIPFERLEAAASGIDGLGLGLALSRNLIEAMQGTIGVDSTPGEGSISGVSTCPT